MHQQRLSSPHFRPARQRVCLYLTLHVHYECATSRRRRACSLWLRATLKKVRESLKGEVRRVVTRTSTHII
jgi:hypothetical protein